VTALLQDLVTDRAARDPDRTALVMEESRLTYGELESSSNRLARMLEQVGCRRGDRVCLFLPKSPAAIVSMLATLKADCTYVPIDIASPAARVARVVESADPRLILVAEEAAGLVGELHAAGAFGPELPIGGVGDATPESPFEATFSDADWASFDAEPLPRANGRADVAHLLFTSGSTGIPKGVMITHDNVLHFVEWATSYFGTREGDRISGHPPLHFDLSTFDIYGTFLAGAELHLVPASYNLLPTKLGDLIRAAELTQWFSVPSTMAHMVKFGVVEPGVDERSAFPSLERVIWCGEVLPTPVLLSWMRAIPQATFTNLYGPTEATIASSYYAVPELPPSETAEIPIGTPCAGEELLVLDEELRPVPDGETGDLFIAGVGLSPGYWRDDEKTQAAFLPDPRSPKSGARIYRTGDLARLGGDGYVYFLGRADSQIKSRGFRIELGEIEVALNTIEEVSECAVVGVDTSGFEGKAICCAFAAADGATIELTALRRRLRKLVPAYMIPAHWIELDELPKNVNGKIDRRHLADLFAEQLGTSEGEAVAKVGTDGPA
jgi:amino acid adenylation domain-containing protein